MRARAHAFMRASMFACVSVCTCDCVCVCCHAQVSVFCERSCAYVQHEGVSMCVCVCFRAPCTCNVCSRKAATWFDCRSLHCLFHTVTNAGVQQSVLQARCARKAAILQCFIATHCTVCFMLSQVREYSKVFCRRGRLQLCSVLLPLTAPSVSCCPRYGSTAKCSGRDTRSYKNGRR